MKGGVYRMLTIQHGILVPENRERKEKITPSFQFAGKGSAPPFSTGKVRPSGFRGKSSSRRSGIFLRKPCLWRRYASRPLKLEKTVSPVNTGMS